MNLSFRTDRPGQTYVRSGSTLSALFYGRATLLKIRIITSIFRLSEYLEHLQYQNSCQCYDRIIISLLALTEQMKKDNKQCLLDTPAQ